MEPEECEEVYLCLLCGKEVDDKDGVLPVRIFQWIGGCGGEDYALVCEDCFPTYMERIYDHVHPDEYKGQLRKAGFLEVFAQMYPNRRSMLQ